MAIRNYDIGGMLARSGQAQGQQMAQGVSAFGQGLGNMLTGISTGLEARRERADEESASEQYRQILDTFQNSPGKMRAAAQQMVGSTNVYLQEKGRLLLEEAARLQSVLDKQSARTTESVEKAKGRYDALKEARADTDTAFDDAVNFRRILVSAKKRAESNEATDKEKKLYELLKTRAITPSEYSKELLEEDKQGSEAKGYKVEKDIITDGTLQSVVEFFDAQGNFLNRKVIGEVAADEDEADQVGRANWKGPDKEAYTLAVNEQRSASAEAVKYNSLLAETENIASGAGDVPIPYIGGVLGLTRDFVISDVAGLGDAITVHRARLNEVRMQNAIALLPRGPASDRDVKLALDASVDPKNLSPEDRVRYIRGMKKLADAEKEYMDGKLRWIEQTGDALAFGYERKVSLDGYGKRIDALRLDNSAEVIELDKELQKVSQLDASGDRDGAKELLDFVKTTDTIGYIDLLQAQAEEQKRYDTFIEANNINFY